MLQGDSTTQPTGTDFPTKREMENIIKSVKSHDIEDAFYDTFSWHVIKPFEWMFKKQENYSSHCMKQSTFFSRGFLTAMLFPWQVWRLDL